MVGSRTRATSGVKASMCKRESRISRQFSELQGWRHRLRIIRFNSLNFAKIANLLRGRGRVPPRVTITRPILLNPFVPPPLPSPLLLLFVFSKPRVGKNPDDFSKKKRSVQKCTMMHRVVFFPNENSFVFFRTIEIGWKIGEENKRVKKKGRTWIFFRKFVHTRYLIKFLLCKFEIRNSKNPSPPSFWLFLPSYYQRSGNATLNSSN